MAVVTGLRFFAALVGHELSHAVVARARGVPVRSITLFALGGVASTEKEAVDPTTEFVMGLVGPVTSAAIGAACLTLAWALGWTPRESPAFPPVAMLVWLGYINLALALFNMIPGFPLDGGRVLRAIVWGITGNASRATRLAAGVGGLWLAFIGWFLLEAARASTAQVEVAEGLRGVRVRDVMARDCPAVDGHMTLQNFAEAHLLRTGRRCFVVVDDGTIAGLITLKALTYAPTGGMVAAPTTSLPERLIGVRNWDYRYCWLRDATFTLYALMSGGYIEEAKAWRAWLLHPVAGTPSQLNIMYGLAGEQRLSELELEWLPGYEGAAPVRIGNAAHRQFQLDVYGEVMDALYSTRSAVVSVSAAASTPHR